VILNAFFVPFLRGLQFLEVKFRSRSFLYRQVLFGGVFSIRFASRNQSVAVTITIDQFSNVVSLCSAISVTELVEHLCDTRGPSIREVRFCILYLIR